MATPPLGAPAPNVNLTDVACVHLANEWDKRAALYPPGSKTRLECEALSIEFLQKAYIAEQNGGEYRGFDPRMPALPGEIERVDMNSGLVKQLKANSFRPSPTPYRLDESLYTLGHYNGIQNLDEATGRTHEFYKKLCEFPVIEAIINFKIGEILPFTTPPTNHKKFGCEIGLKDRNAPVTRAVQKRIDQLNELVAHCGFLRVPDGTGRGKYTYMRNPVTGEPGVWDGLGREKAMPFPEFTQCFLRCSLTMDWAAARSEPAEGMEEAFPVVFFAPMASELVRRVTRDYRPAILKDEIISYVEVDPFQETNVAREFTWNRMMTMVRRPRTDFWGRGYGHPEAQTLVREIATMVLGMDQQKAHLDENYVPVGMMQFNGMPVDMDPQVEDELRRHLMRFGGTGNWYRMLMLFFPQGGGEAKFTAMRDAMGAQAALEYNLKFLMFLITLGCSVYQINPQAIGFPGIQMQSTLNSADPQSLLDASTDKSRDRTLVQYFNVIQTNIIERYDPDFEIRPVGVITETQESKDAAIASLMGQGYTTNDINKQFDIQALRLPLAPWIMYQVRASLDPEQYDTRQDYEKHCEKVYEKRFEKEVGGAADGLPSPWSQVPDAPLGAPGSSLNVWMSEQERVTQAVAARARQAAMEKMGLPKGLDPEIAGQMMQMGFPVKGMPEPPVDPNDPNNQQGKDGEEDDKDLPAGLQGIQQRSMSNPFSSVFGDKKDDPEDDRDDNPGEKPDKSTKPSKPLPSNLAKAVLSGDSRYERLAASDESDAPVIDSYQRALNTLDAMKDVDAAVNALRSRRRNKPAPSAPTAKLAKAAELPPSPAPSPDSPHVIEVHLYASK